MMLLSLLTIPILYSILTMNFCIPLLLELEMLSFRFPSLLDRLLINRRERREELVVSRYGTNAWDHAPLLQRVLSFMFTLYPAAVANVSNDPTESQLEAKEALVVEELNMESDKIEHQDSRSAGGPVDIEMDQTGNHTEEHQTRNVLGGFTPLGAKQDIDLYKEAIRELDRRRSLDRIVPSFQSTITVATLKVSSPQGF